MTSSSIVLATATRLRPAANPRDHCVREVSVRTSGAARWHLERPWLPGRRSVGADCCDRQPATSPYDALFMQLVDSRAQPQPQPQPQPTMKHCTSSTVQHCTRSTVQVCTAFSKVPVDCTSFTCELVTDRLLDYLRTLVHRRAQARRSGEYDHILHPGSGAAPIAERDAVNSAHFGSAVDDRTPRLRGVSRRWQPLSDPGIAADVGGRQLMRRHGRGRCRTARKHVSLYDDRVTACWSRELVATIDRRCRSGDRPSFDILQVDGCGDGLRRTRCVDSLDWTGRTRGHGSDNARRAYRRLCGRPIARSRVLACWSTRGTKHHKPNGDDCEREMAASGHTHQLNTPPRRTLR